LCSLRCNRSSSLFDMIKLIWFRFIFSWVVNIVLNQRLFLFLRSVTFVTLLDVTFYFQIFCFCFTIFIEIIVYWINKLFFSISLFDVIIIFSFESIVVMLNCVQTYFFLILVVGVHLAFSGNIKPRVLMIRNSCIHYVRGQVKTYSNSPVPGTFTSWFI